MSRDIVQWLGRLSLAAAALAALVYPSLTDAREKVILQLRWDHQFQFAGYYAAQWRGHYADAGLDVEIRSAFEPSGKFQNAINEVVETRADFGTAGADLLEAVDKGAPLTIVASIFQRSPVAFYARAETGLKTPADLARLRVGARPGGIAGVELRAMLRAENIDPALVPLRRIQGRLGIDDIADGLLDVASGFTISAGWVAREHGLTLTALHPATYGVDFYGSALFTHRRWIENDPELVRRFVTASLKGWKDALTQPEEIADRIARELSRTIAVRDLRGLNRFQIAPVRKLTHFPIVELGHTNPARWRRMHDALEDAGVVKGSFAPDDLFFDPERLARERSERIAMIVFFILIAGLAAAAGGWIWNARRSGAQRRRTDEELRDNEQRLRSIADHIPGDIYRRILHPDGRITYAYMGGELNERLGLPAKAALTDPKKFFDLVHPEDFPAWQEAVRVSAENLTPFDMEIRIVTKWGEVRWINSRAQPRRGNDGDIIWDGVALDITDRKSAEEKAGQHQAELARVLRLGTMGEMASALAHEINQPLAAIYNYSRGCMRRIETGNSTPEELTGVLGQISGQAERAGKVIRNLGDFVRKGEPNLTRVNVNDLVQVVAELAQVELERGRVKLQRQLANDLPPLMVDRIEIEQVILNLVRNGIEAMQEVPARQRTLAIRTSRRDDEEVEIVVSDTGSGVPDAGSRIFDAFFTTKANGLGMGLAISRTILEAHHGRLWVEPNEARGAAFHIALPVRQRAETHG